MKLKIMIMTLLLVSAVGIGSAVNRIPESTMVGDLDMGGYNITDQGNPAGGYTTKVYLEGTKVIAQWANGTIIYYGDATTQSREAIQAAVSSHNKTTLLCNRFTTDDDIPIYLNSTDVSDPVQHRIVGLGINTGIIAHTGTQPVLYAYDGDSRTISGTNCSENSIILQNFAIFVPGGRDGIKLENLGNGFQGHDICNMYLKTTGTPLSGALINISATGSFTIHDNYIIGSINPLSSAANQKDGIYIYSSSDDYYTTGIRIENNHMLYLRNGVHIQGVNQSYYTYTCGFNLIDNFILGCNAAFRGKWIDSPIIMGNVMDNNNLSILLYDVHGAQIIGNELGCRFNVGSTVNERGDISIYNIELNAPESGTIISNNRMITYGSGGPFHSGYAQILIYVNGGKFSKSKIFDNEIRTYTESGIRLVRGSGTLDATEIRGNTISDFSSGNGVTIVGDGITNTRIVLNQIDTYSTITDTGTGTVIQLNTGYVTENSGSSTGTGSEQTIPHGLASTPFRVSVTPTASGATATWRADATNIYPTVTNGKTYNWAASTW